MPIDWGFSLAVVVTGLVVVFVVLFLLVAMCSIMGSIFKNIGKKNAEKAAQAAKSPVSAPTIPVPPVAQVEIAYDGVTDDEVAAISAAIAVIMSDSDGSKPFAIKSIKKVKEALPAWRSAGIADNTRQF